VGEGGRLSEERILPVKKGRGGRIREYGGGYHDGIPTRDEIRVSRARESYDYTLAERAKSIERAKTYERTGTKIMPKIAERKRSNFGIKLAVCGVALLLILFFLFLLTPLGPLIRSLIPFP
jgi:hypothetical protein